MNALTQLSTDPRVTIRRAGPADPEGTCVVYWMQRAQRSSLREFPTSRPLWRNATLAWCFAVTQITA